MKYIHIGFSKTGTIWLQKVVFPEWMKENNVAFFQRMKAEDFRQTPRDKILISNQTITARSTFYLGGLTESLQNMVNLFGKDIKVIITNRETNSWRESLYLDQVLHGYRTERIASILLLKMKNEVYDYLKDNDIPYIVLSTDQSFDYYRLADFMDIKYPTAEQKTRWNVRVNKRRSPFVMFIVRICNRLGLNKIRKLIIFFTK